MQGKQGELAPPTTMLGKAATRVVECLESGIRKHSVFGDRPLYPTDWFPWARQLEANWQLIRQELDVVLQRREELPAFHELSSAVKTITTDAKWKTYPFYAYGLSCPESCQACPETARLLGGIPGLMTAFFSILSPRKLIPPHRGPYNGVLRFHLGLRIPQDRQSCRIRIDKEIYSWREGEALIFDDCFDHQVWNETDEERVVLFVDFVRPTRFPVRWFNEALLKIAPHTPMLREINDNTQNWVRGYFGTSAAAAAQGKGQQPDAARPEQAEDIPVADAMATS